MVFANLRNDEKEAFFGLLDEYFTTRPDLLARLNGAASESSNGVQNAAQSAGVAGVAAAQRAFASNPEATAKFVSAGLRHANSPGSEPSSNRFGSLASNPNVSNAAGRVAAAASVFGRDRDATNQNAPPAPPPPVLPRRTTGASDDSSSIQEPPSRPPTKPKTFGAPNLVSIKRFGSDVDTSSAKNMFTSLRNSTTGKNAPPPSIVLPSAFAKKKNDFMPPPTRRVSPPPAAPSPPAPAYHQEEPEPEEEGEWAEALYDYISDEYGDLQIRENQRVKIIDRSSNDWWTGEVDGKSGVFPASYVKLL